MIDIPVIKTERLVLRGPKAEDFKGFADFFASDRAQYAGGKKTPAEAWMILASDFGHWQMRGFGRHIITRKGDDRAIGLAGGYYPETRPERETGWVLFYGEDEGQGIAKEAAIATIDHIWNDLNWPTVVSYIHPDNASSIALAERLGATLDESATQPKPDQRTLVYRHFSPKELS